MPDFLVQNEYIQFLLILISSISFAAIFNLVFSVYIKKITEKTENKIDDVLLKIITRPIFLYIFFMGIYFSVKRLTVLNSYNYYIDEAFFVLIILISSYLISKIFSFGVSFWLKTHEDYERTPRLLNRLVAIAIYIIGLAIIFTHFRIQITPLIATLGVGGLAVGLAIKNTLTNFFAGIHLLSDRPISVEDYIEIPKEEIKGYVQDIGWRSTRIKSLAGNIIIVPNSKLAENTIINNYLPKKKLFVVVECGIAYDSDLEKVEKVTLDIAQNIQKTSKGAVRGHKPSFKFRKFSESNIDFSIVLGVENIADKYNVRHEFIKALMKKYRQEEIVISYPVRKIVNG